MIRKAVSVFLLLIILSGSVAPVTFANTNQVDRAAICAESSQTFRTNLLGFVVSNLLWGGVSGAALLGIDKLTSYLEKKQIHVKPFGIGITITGAMLEPLEQAIGFIRDIWMQALIWGVISSTINFFAGHLIEAGIALNLTLSAGNPLISYGGRIILQIVNLGLVLSIIFIGITTILRLKEDKLSADNLLIKLIIGIIFVNLTIPAAISIAGIGTRITEVIYLSSAPCPINITHQFTAWELKNRFNTLLTGRTVIITEEFEELPIEEGLTIEEQKRLEEQQTRAREASAEFQGILGGLTADFLSLIAGSAMSFIAALTFLVFAIFLLIRFVMLMLLITFSPLIWFGFIFSDLKIEGFGNIWSGWWSQFLQWTFFGPVIVLFLAFVSEYLYSIEAYPIILTGVPGFTQNFIQVAQLLAVLLISAIGLYATSKFSGVAGKLVMQAASGGLGFVANKAQGAFKKAQIGSDMRAKEEELKGNKGKAKAFNLLSRAAERTEASLDLNKKPFNLLPHVGIKPVVKSPDEAGIKRDIIARKVRFLKPTPKDILSLTKKEFDELPKDTEDGEKARKSFVSALYETQKDFQANPSTFTPEQITAFKKLEKDFAPELAKATLNDIALPPVGTTMATTDAEKMVNMGDASLNSYISDRTPEMTAKGVAAVAAISDAVKAGTMTLTPEQAANFRKLETSFAPNLVEATLKDMPLTASGTMATSDAEKILNMADTSINSLTRNNTPEMTEKSVAAILQLETELRSGTITLDATQRSKLQTLRSGFSNKVITNIIDSTATSATNVIKFSNAELSQIGKKGHSVDKKTIEDALIDPSVTSLTGVDAINKTRVDTQIKILKAKRLW